MKLRDLIKLIEKDGWKLARTRGSHHQYRHSVKRGTVTVADIQLTKFIRRPSVVF